MLTQLRYERICRMDSLELRDLPVISPIQCRVQRWEGYL
jgi:hypothetical protein